MDFKKNEFPVLVKDNYYDLLRAYKKKDKVALMQLLSVPLYDVFLIFK